MNAYHILAPELREQVDGHVNRMLGEGTTYADVTSWLADLIEQPDAIAELLKQDAVRLLMLTATLERIVDLTQTGVTPAGSA